MSEINYYVKEPWWKTFLFGYKCPCCGFRQHTLDFWHGIASCFICRQVLKEYK